MGSKPSKAKTQDVPAENEFTDDPEGEQHDPVGSEYEVGPNGDGEDRPREDGEFEDGQDPEFQDPDHQTEQTGEEYEPTYHDNEQHGGYDYTSNQETTDNQGEEQYDTRDEVTPIHNEHTQKEKSNIQTQEPYQHNSYKAQPQHRTLDAQPRQRSSYKPEEDRQYEREESQPEQTMESSSGSAKPRNGKQHKHNHKSRYEPTYDEWGERNISEHVGVETDAHADDAEGSSSLGGRRVSDRQMDGYTGTGSGAIGYGEEREEMQDFETEEDAGGQNRDVLDDPRRYDRRDEPSSPEVGAANTSTLKHGSMKDSRVSPRDQEDEEHHVDTSRTGNGRRPPENYLSSTNQNTPRDRKDWRDWKEEQYQQLLLSKLREACKLKDKDGITAALEECATVPAVAEHKQFKKGKKLQLVLQSRDRLRDARARAHLADLQDEIEEIRVKGYLPHLQQEVIEAESIATILEREQRPVVTPSLDLNSRMVSEIRRYKTPPTMLCHIVQATLLLLGEDEYTTSDWGTCQKLLATQGKDSTVRQMQQLNKSYIHPQIWARAKQILQPYSLKQALKAGPAAASFYVWSMGTIDECERSHENQYDPPKPANKQRQLEILGRTAPEPKWSSPRR